MKTKFIIFLILTICNKTVAQDVNGIYGSENWLQGWTNFKPIGTEYKSPNVILIGRINQNTTLYKKNIYLLNGNVCITDNAVLTIEPGTLIRGDFETCGTLIITKGAFKPTEIVTGKNTFIGNIDYALASITTATQLTIEVSIANTNYSNDWNKIGRAHV